MSTAATNFSRSTNVQSIGWFLDLHSSGRLDLDPPYQRRSVWNLQYKQFFIDSLIRNYPAPTIFLQVDVSVDRPMIYRVIDGKQRLSALFEFQRDEFTTPDGLNDLDLGDKYFSELPEEVKLELLEYVFTVENIKKASTAELNNAFDRLNRNVGRLNKQELRHAKFDGAFIRKVEELAEHPFWAEIGLVTPARVRRMQDVEYVSELYIVSLDGIQEGKDYLDDFYANYDKEIPGKVAADERFIAVQDYLKKVHQATPLKGSRFSNVADFYSLWAAVTSLHESGLLPEVEDSGERLNNFSAELADQETPRARRYRIAALQGSNKKSNRELRSALLRDVLLGS
ncbi:DUF262 domain-containing protein [Streptomyces sp. DSM 44915]|uniref:DUF262 domain-containing protein n=1 Tax=Streptomyces chisholmiae TaxID=3075540 RepID=A0ABU2JKR6_9ACTN|nr:DUF262 domain-containing protein [Streptomyces sp. DSM 44915]MDT0265577.1 DUF262 domain-containing protein [Streptomyces sp. DSM 44915]